MTRRELITHLIERIFEIQKDSPVLIGIDGVDASGKTTLADQLQQALKNSDREIIRASIDGFHNSKKIRYARGNDSPKGYYQDSFNYELVKSRLLDPLLSGNLEYITQSFDHNTDSEIVLPVKKAAKNAILIMDGIFLHRPELIDYWDLSIFLDIDFKIALQRNISRQIKEDTNASEEKITQRYNTRYMPGQQLYLHEVNPKENAEILIDNSDFEKPSILRSSKTVGLSR